MPTLHWTPTMQPLHADRRIQLGETMYLFQHQPGVFARDLLITAHGGIAGKNSPVFQVPDGVTVSFYCLHGQNASGWAYSGALVRGNRIKQTLAGGQQCYDYSLSKFQGRHGGGTGNIRETYEEIQRDQAANQGMANFDVLTVRNRGLFSTTTVKLSEAIASARAQNAYIEVHCSFCRAID